MVIDFQKFQTGLEYREARELHLTSFQIFQWNGNDLVALIKKLETPNPEASVRHRLDEHVNVLRHFHNFAASAMSLVDASRRWIEKFAVLKPEYDQKVQEIYSPKRAHQLVQGLRVYFLHCGIPRSTTMNTTTLQIDFQSNVHQRTEKNSFILHVGSLLKWEKWKNYPEAKSYLENFPQGEDLDLLGVVEPYRQQTQSFYDWFYRRMDEHHRELIEVLWGTPNPLFKSGWTI